MQPKKAGAVRRQRHVGSLDGLRAIAILAILAYHLNLPWIPSGNLGVVIFLVLAGYLGTTSILRAHARSGGIGPLGLVRLWWKRFIRLWPQVLTVVVLTASLCGLFDHVLLTKMRPDVLPGLGFFLNWSYIMRGASYFSQVGGPSPLLHLWYLGVDLQFFVVWSLVVAILARIGRKTLRRVALVLAAISAVWMAVCYVPGTDPSRVYYGTDTRAFSLLLGSWLACAFPLNSMPVVGQSLLVRRLTPRPPKHGRRGRVRVRPTMFAHLAGIIALAALVALMVVVPRDTAFWYYGGMLFATLLTVLLIACLLVPGSVSQRVFSFPVLTYLGRRSFALYVWHFPIFALMAAGKTTTPWQLRLAAVGVALVAAEVSYWFVEKTITPSSSTRKNGRAEKPSTARGSQANKARSSAISGVVAVRLAITSLVIAAASGYGTYALLTTPDETLVPEEHIVSTGESANEARDLSKETEPQEEEQSQPSSSSSRVAAAFDATTDTIARNLTEFNATIQQLAQQAEEKSQEEESRPVEVTESTVVHAPAEETQVGIRDPVLIGDSVPGDADWSGRLPEALVDTFIGRRPDQAIDVLKGYLKQGAVGKVVVFACFSNVTPLPEQLDTIVELLGDGRQVYLVGTVNPDGFQDAANQNLQDAASRYEDVHYVDWPAVCKGHEKEYLWADVTHLRPEGGTVYVDMIVRAIAQSLVDAGGSVD